ncbi:probable serine/threonine-protein kinase PBL17 [Elaeis guineensis]|uniref:probable serine/threonine-protein kinase PBL17 n=1 Tax=Elaeis guineensis var. tenera TaxID=51953 RepID=UPI003C6DB0A0
MDWVLEGPYWFSSVKEINDENRQVVRKRRHSGQPVSILEFTESEIGHFLNQAHDTIIGEGQSARVWVGLIPDGFRHGLSAQHAAVKEYNYTSHDTFDLWEIERVHLMKLAHPNIIKLIGYCHHKPHNGQEKKVLVLEHMPGGNLNERLFHIDKWNNESVEWDKRVRILHDAAKAIKYLHGMNLIYRDLKAENILLDSDMNAKLVDFGAMIDGPRPPNAYIETPQPIGTMGYTDPSYIETGRANMGIDIYSFGVLILVVILGRRAVTTKKKTELSVKINEKYKDRPLDLLRSKKLRRDSYRRKELQSLLDLARRCLEEASKRPTCDGILREFENIQAAKTWPPSGFDMTLDSLSKGFPD